MKFIRSILSSVALCSVLLSPWAVASGSGSTSDEVESPQPSSSSVSAFITTPPKEVAGGKKAYIVGEKIDVVVEVLAETFFSGPTRFILPDIPGAVFYKPEERAVVSSKEIDGVTWSVQRHEFAFYPQRAGKFTIPAFEVRYGVAGVGGAKPTFKRELTKPLQITASMPKGAEHLKRLISAPELSVEESWSPDVSDKKRSFVAGNAIKRNIVFRADSVPGMVFPAIRIPEIDGVKIYRSRAQVHDTISRGTFTGERSETITYVFQRAGKYVFPEVKIHWWDLSEKRLKQIVLPSVTFDVAPAPLTDGVGGNQGETFEGLSKTTVFGLLGLFLIVGGIFWFRLPIQKWMSDMVLARQESESAYFKRITPDLSAVEMWNAITRWRAKVDGGSLTLQEWAAQQDDSDHELTREIDALQQAMVSENSTWDGTVLFGLLQKVRKRKKSQRPLKQPLPKLNP